MRALITLHRLCSICLPLVALMVACTSTRINIQTSEISTLPTRTLDQETATSEISARHPCNEPVVDEDGDGEITQRDRYLRDYRNFRDGKPVCHICDINSAIRRYTFDFNQAALNPRVIALLDEDIETLKKYPDMVIEVAGHTDSIGTENYNQKLSLRRAREAYNYLIKNGIKRSRLSGPTGYGETRPIAPNTDEYGSDYPSGRANNRRIELNLKD